MTENVKTRKQYYMVTNELYTYKNYLAKEFFIYHLKQNSSIVYVYSGFP